MRNIHSCDDITESVKQLKIDMREFFFLILFFYLNIKNQYQADWRN